MKFPLRSFLQRLGLAPGAVAQLSEVGESTVDLDRADLDALDRLGVEDARARGDDEAPPRRREPDPSDLIAAAEEMFAAARRPAATSRAVAPADDPAALRAEHAQLLREKAEWEAADRVKADKAWSEGLPARVRACMGLGPRPTPRGDAEAEALRARVKAMMSASR